MGLSLNAKLHSSAMCIFTILSILLYLCVCVCFTYFFIFSYGDINQLIYIYIYGLMPFVILNSSLSWRRIFTITRVDIFHPTRALLTIDETLYRISRWFEARHTEVVRSGSSRIVLSVTEYRTISERISGL